MCDRSHGGRVVPQQGALSAAVDVPISSVQRGSRDNKPRRVDRVRVRVVSGVQGIALTQTVRDR